MCGGGEGGRGVVFPPFLFLRGGGGRDEILWVRFSRCCCLASLHLFCHIENPKKRQLFFSKKDPYRTREHHQTCPKNRSYFFGVSFYVGNMKMPSSLDRRVGTQRRSEQPKTGEDVLSMFTPPKLLRVRRRKRKEGGRGRDCNHPARNGKEKDGDCDVAFPRRRREI